MPTTLCQFIQSDAETLVALRATVDHLIAHNKPVLCVSVMHGPLRRCCIAVYNMSIRIYTRHLQLRPALSDLTCDDDKTNNNICAAMYD